MRLIDIDAIKIEKGFFENINNVPKFFEWLGKQPTVDPMKWIPVSERLPKKNGEYFVTEIDCITSERLTDIAYYGNFISTNNGFHKTNDVVAWMPLPMPWKGERNE